MAKKYFLKLDNVRGDSQSPRHHGEIEINSFAFGGRHQQPGGAGGAGKASFSDLTISKRSDNTSRILWVACQSGQYFKEAVLTAEDVAGQGSLIRATIVELRSLSISSITGSVNGTDEDITFSFEAMNFKQA